MSKHAETDDWPIERTWTIDCSRCKDEGQAYEDTASPEWAISILKDMGWTLEWEGVWRAYCPRCNETRKPVKEDV